MFRLSQTSNPLPTILCVLAAAVVLVSPGDSRAQSCAPATCGASFTYFDFESLAPGTSIEGLGALDSDLTISTLAWPFGPACTVGSAAVIEEGNVVPFVAYDTGGGTMVNGCLNGNRGFGDPGGCVLDYDFDFGNGALALCFGLRIVDYGDFFPFGGTNHVVQLTAYDASNTQVDQDVLTMTGPVDLVLGDACTTQPGAFGNQILSVSWPGGIKKVTLRFNAYPDPNIGFDDLAYCKLYVLPAGERSWGELKSTYR
jgi:hypothetical protein